MDRLLRTRLRAGIAAFALTGAIFAGGAIACGDDEDGDATIPVGSTTTPGGATTGTATSGTGTETGATATRDATGTATENGDSGTPSPTTGGGGGNGGGDLTGVSDVDEIIMAAEEGDFDTVIDAIQFLRTECTTAQGAGGPPKCEAGETDGTTVSVFPVQTCQGEHVREEQVDAYLDQSIGDMDLTLYAVIEFTEDPESDLFPVGDYGAIYEGEEHPVMFGITESGDVVTYATGCGGDAAELFEIHSADGEVIVEPD